MADPRYYAVEGMHYLPGFGQFVEPSPQEINVKREFEEFLRSARDELLTRAGSAIARTPQGRAAIEAEARRQAVEKAQGVAKAGVPLVIGAIIIGSMLMAGRKR